MRDEDYRRLLLGRLFGTEVDVREIIDTLMTPIINPIVRASITIQAYGRGLLARFRDHRLGYSNFVPSTRKRMRVYKRNPVYQQGQDLFEAVYFGGTTHDDLVEQDDRGLNAIRNSKAFRRSRRKIGLLRAGRSDYKNFGGMEHSRAERWYERADARLRWMLLM